MTLRFLLLLLVMGPGSLPAAGLFQLDPQAAANFPAAPGRANAPTWPGRSEVRFTTAAHEALWDGMPVHYQRLRGPGLDFLIRGDGLEYWKLDEPGPYGFRARHYFDNRVQLYVTAFKQPAAFLPTLADEHWDAHLAMLHRAHRSANPRLLLNDDTDKGGDMVLICSGRTRSLAYSFQEPDAEFAVSIVRVFVMVDAHLLVFGLEGPSEAVQLALADFSTFLLRFGPYSSEP